MKRTTYLLLASFLMIAFLVISNPLSAQEPPHPPTVGHGSKGNQAPAGAPIDGGLGLLISLGLAYGIKKSRGISKIK
jgi:hypothetical protein